jgi:RNA polymerase sigma factor (sigma-70 family)
MVRKYELSDDLLSRLKSDDQPAWAVAYAAMAPLMHKVLGQYTRDVGLREDLVQETMLKIYRNIQKIENVEHLTGAACNSARQRWIDYLRSKGKNDGNTEYGDVTNDNNSPHANHYVSAQQYNRLHLQQVLHTLSIIIGRANEAHRVVLEKVYYEGDSYEECAQALGLLMGTFKSRKNRAERWMFEQMEQEDIGEYRNHIVGNHAQIADMYSMIAENNLTHSDGN